MDILEQAVWIRVVNACTADHFNESDIPLMIGYCQVFVQLQRAITELKESPFTIMADNGKVSAHPIVAVHKSLSGTLSNLAMRLRLSPSTRISTKAAATGSALPPPKVTEGDEVDELFFPH